MPKYDYQKTLLIPGDKSSCDFQTAETGNIGVILQIHGKIIKNQ